MTKWWISISFHLCVAAFVIFGLFNWHPRAEIEGNFQRQDRMGMGYEVIIELVRSHKMTNMASRELSQGLYSWSALGEFPSRDSRQNEDEQSQWIGIIQDEEVFGRGDREDIAVEASQAPLLVKIMLNSAAAGSNSRGIELARRSLGYLGYPYVWGGASPAGFDCSGYVQYLYKRMGISIPRLVRGQFQSGKLVSIDTLQIGDLVFFKNTNVYGLSHVGIYLGGGRFIHAASEERGISIDDLTSSFWWTCYCGARRLE